MEVEAQEPEDEAMIKTLDQMRSRGIKLLYGRWLIEGAPRVLLFDTGSAYQHLDEWKGDLWNLAGIPTPPNDHETNETIVFGYLVAWFLGEVSVFSIVHFFRASPFLCTCMFHFPMFPLRFPIGHYFVFAGLYSSR